LAFLEFFGAIILTSKRDPNDPALGLRFKAPRCTKHRRLGLSQVAATFRGTACDSKLPPLNYGRRRHGPTHASPDYVVIVFETALIFLEFRGISSGPF
jgi:hypothetical protein